MSQNRLSVYHSIISVMILLLVLSMIKYSSEHIFLYAELFMIVKSFVDIVFHRLGYSFRGFGIKKMLIINLILLLIFSIWHIFVFI